MGLKETPGYVDNLPLAKYLIKEGNLNGNIKHKDRKWQN